VINTRPALKLIKIIPITLLFIIDKEEFSLKMIEYRMTETNNRAVE